MEVSRAFSTYNRERDAAWNEPILADVRARMRSEIVGKRFSERHGRDPVDARELAGFVAAESRPKAAPVAGFDLTFSPVKSVSALWALAPPGVAEKIVAAHDAAVADVIGWLEQEVAFTRTGRAGIRQVPVVGLVAAAFTHRDSRARDPDLHTHVAVSNKVQSTPEHQSKWLALDGRILFKAKVAACERYNTRIEAELVARLGVRFTDRRADAGKRPVREIERIDPILLSVWSKRRHAINLRQARLAARFQAEHGRPPTPIESQALAQQANLETREDKHKPGSEAEQRSAWRQEAQEYGVDPDTAVELAASYGLVAVDDDRSGPLPWLPAIPQQLADHASWGAYLRDRGDLVRSLADQVALAALTDAPTSADGLTPRLTTEIAVWRAAYGVPESDPRPTGPRVEGRGWDHQRRLDRQISELLDTATNIDWGSHLPAAVLEDRASGHLRRKLDELRQSRPDVPALVQKALDNPRPLPVENPADALWWRVVAADAKAPPPKPARQPTTPVPAPAGSPSHPSPSPRRDRPTGVGR